MMGVRIDDLNFQGLKKSEITCATSSIPRDPLMGLPQRYATSALPMTIIHIGNLVGMPHLPPSKYSRQDNYKINFMERNIGLNITLVDNIISQPIVIQGLRFRTKLASRGGRENHWWRAPVGGCNEHSKEYTKLSHWTDHTKQKDLTALAFHTHRHT